MALIGSIKKRYSCRKYADKPVEKEKLDEIFEAARLAPSAKNLQDWRFVVVTDPKTRAGLSAAANNQDFITQTGAVIVACSICADTMTCGQKVAPIDVAIAMEHIALQATELGLATCWVGSFYPDKVRAVLDIPSNIEIVELMALGYPADQYREPSRESVEKIVCFEKWQF